MDNIDNLTTKQVEKIMENARKIAKQHGTTVSTTRLWTLLLLSDYAMRLDNVSTFSRDENDLTIDLSVNEMAREFNQPKRTVVEALKGLASAGLITRTKKDENKSIPGVITTINKEVFG